MKNFRKMKRGNGSAKNAKAPVSLTAVQQVQERIDTYEKMLEERLAKIEEVKAQVDQLTAQILQIRGALEEGREVFKILNPENEVVVIPSKEPEENAEV